MRKQVAGFVVVTGLLATTQQAHAAGYYVSDIGARALARGGASIVDAGDPSAIWSNPAAITNAKGLQLQLDVNTVQLSSSFIRDCGGIVDGCGPAHAVSRSYKTGGRTDSFVVTNDRPAANSNATPGNPDVNSLGLTSSGASGAFNGKTDTTRNLAGVQPIPRLFATLNLDTFGLDGFAVGASVFAPSAGAYKFSPDAPTRYTLIDRTIYELYYGVTLAYRYKNWIALGASLQGVSSGLDQSVRLSADQGANEDPGSDIQVRIQGTQNLIPSGNFGVWSSPLDGMNMGKLEIGGSVQLGRTVHAVGPLTIQSFGATLQKDFIDTGLLKVDAKNATATSDFVLPPFYRAGLKYGLDDVTGDGKNTVAFDVEADYVFEQWSTYDHVAVTTSGISFATGGNPPTALPPIIQAKDWTDTHSVRLGGTLGLWDRALEIHAGGYYETSAVPNTTYDIEVADGDKVGVAGGLSGTWNGIRGDLGYSHVFIFDRTVGDESIVFNGTSGKSTLFSGETRTRVAMGKYTAGYDMLNVGITVSFDTLLGFGEAHKKAAVTTSAPAPAPVPEAAPAATPAPAPVPAPASVQ